MPLRHHSSLFERSARYTKHHAPPPSLRLQADIAISRHRGRRPPYLTLSSFDSRTEHHTCYDTQSKLATTNMASSTANLGGPVSPTITLEALEAITSRPADAPRRCFICLTDEEPSDNPSDWVSPCPCTLEAHQDCILEWVTDCERSSKPLNCPICKSPIHMEGPSDLLVCLSDSFSRRFTKVSPFLLLIGATAGAQVTLEAYGRLAMRIFSGKRALRDFTWDFTKSAFSLKSRAIRSSRSALILTCVAPALVVGQLLPNMMFLPTASVVCFICPYYDFHPLTGAVWALPHHA